MFSDLLFGTDASASTIAIVSPAGSVTRSELRQMDRLLRDQLEFLSERRVGLIFRSNAESYATLAALDELRCDVFLLNAQLPDRELICRAESFRFGAIVDPQPN